LYYPKCVYELLGLLRSRGGRILETEIPERLRIAIPICRGGNPLIAAVPVAGAMFAPRPPTTWKLTREGDAVLALHLVSEADRASTEAASERPKQSPSVRITVDLARMQVTLDGVSMECNSVQALRLVQVYAEHPDVWISASELKNYDTELIGAKPHVLKKLLPLAIRSLIESDRRKGSRLTFSTVVVRP
jgi:hypothetical protein